MRLCGAALHLGAGQPAGCVQRPHRGDGKVRGILVSTLAAANAPALRVIVMTSANAGAGRGPAGRGRHGSQGCQLPEANCSPRAPGVQGTRLRMGDPAPEAFVEQFDVNWRRKLGQGAFSRVYECCELATNTLYAVKIVDFSRWRLLKSFNAAHVLREAAVMKGLDHENIVSVRAVFQSPNAMWLVQELAAGSELFQVVVRGGALAEVRWAAVRPPPST